MVLYIQTVPLDRATQEKKEQEKEKQERKAIEFQQGLDLHSTRSRSKGLNLNGSGPLTRSRRNDVWTSLARPTVNNEA